MRREDCPYFGKFPPGVFGTAAVPMTIKFACGYSRKLCKYRRGDIIDACDNKKQYDKERGGHW